MDNFSNILKKIILCGFVFLSSACSANDRLPVKGQYGQHLDYDSQLQEYELHQLGIGIEDDDHSLTTIRYSIDPEDNPYRLVIITKGKATTDIDGQFEWNVKLFSDTDGESNIMNNRATEQTLGRHVKLKQGQAFVYVDPLEAYSIPEKINLYEMGVMLSLKRPEQLEIESVSLQLWSNRKAENE